MADTIEFGIKLTGDGTALVGSVQVAKASVDQLKQSFSSVGDHLDQLLAQTGRTAQSFGGVGQAGKKALKDTSDAADVASDALKKLAGYITVGAITAWASGVVGAAATLRDLSTITGSTVESLSKLSNVAIVSGQGTDILRLGLERLSYAMNNQDLEATRAQKALAFLGITAKDPAEAYQQLADKIALYADGTSKAAVVQDILGRGAQNQLPLLAKLAENHRIAATTTTLQAVEAQKLAEELRLLGVNAGGLKDILLSDLVPALNTTIEKLQEGSKAAGGFWSFIFSGASLADSDNTVAKIAIIQKKLADLEELRASMSKNSFFSFFNSDDLTMISGQVAVLTADLTRLQALVKINPNRGSANPQSVYGDAWVTKPDLGYTSPALGAAGAGDATLQSFYAILAAREAAEAASAKRIDDIQTAGYKRELDDLNTYHQLGIISEQQYIDQQADIATRAAQAKVDQNKAVLEGLKADLTAVQSKGATTPKEVQEQKAEELKLNMAIADAINRTALAEAALEQVSVQRGNATSIANKKQLDELTKIRQATQDYVAQLKAQSDEINFQTSLIGKTDLEQRQLTADRQIQLDLDTRLLAIDLELAAVGLSDPAKTAELLQQRKDLTQAATEYAAKVRDGIAAQNAAQERMTGFTDAWQAVKDTVAGTADALRNGWSSAIDYVKSRLVTVLVKYLEELATKQFVLPLFISATNAPGGLGQGPGSFPLLNSASSLFGGGGGFGGVGTSVLGGIASTGPGGAAFAAGAAGDAFMPAMATAAGGAPLMAGIGEALTTTLASIPVYGWIALAALAAYEVFSKKEPSPVKGQFGISAGTTGFEDNAFTKSKFGNLGFVDAGTQQFSGSAAQQFNQLINTTLDAIAKRLTPEQIASASAKLQGTTFAGKEGTFTTEDFLSKYGAEVLKKVVSVVLGELNPALGTLVGTFKGTAEETVAYANSLLAISDAIGGNVATDAAKAFTAATNSSIDNINLLRQNVFDMAAVFDGSAQSATDLANASGAYRSVLVQELVAIKQVTASLHAMFDTTRTTIEFAGLDKQSTYDLYQKKAKDDFSKIALTADPAEVNRLATEINGFLNQAFNLLSPEEQLANKQTWLDKVNVIDKAVSDRLAAIGDKLTTDSKDPFAAVQTALDKAAATMQTAANTMNGAANTMANAANTLADSSGGQPATVVVVPSYDAVGP